MADWLCGFALLAGLFCAPSDATLSAYVEGEAVYLAPLEVVRIDGAKTACWELRTANVACALHSRCGMVGTQF